MASIEEIFTSTAQRSFISPTKEQIRNAKPERGPDIRVSVLSIGKGSYNKAMQSVNTSNFGSMDTATHSPAHVGHQRAPTSISMGTDGNSWSTTAGDVPAPEKGVQYTPFTNIKGAMAQSHWDAGTDKVGYVSAAAASNSKANSPIVRTQPAKPAKSNNVALGYDPSNYETEEASSFKRTRVSTAERRDKKAVLQHMKKTIRQSNINLGGKGGYYSTASNEGLFNPRGSSAAYKAEPIDKTNLNKTNFVVGYEWGYTPPKAAEHRITGLKASPYSVNPNSGKPKESPQPRPKNQFATRSSIMFGDNSRKHHYETTSMANLGAYTPQDASQVQPRQDPQRSSISLGKSKSVFQTSAQRSFNAGSM